ncbi:MAG: lytic murein transglycosylase, partial [Cyanobacteria bacterium]|nr:lytic murein transglycosylase [Cyanobacteriota bacterium]
MKRLLILLCMLGFSLCHADTAQTYLHRFMAYTEWNQHLPENPDSQFLAFIDSDTPLAKKLREKWLYQIGRQKDWPTYLEHYKETDAGDKNLQCWAYLAEYNTSGNLNQTLQRAKVLWLNGEGQPAVCNPLLELLTQDSHFDPHLIDLRIALALEKNNVPLARYLLKQYQPPRLKDEQLLTQIMQSPQKITQLQRGPLHDLFYLYGLKRLVSSNMNQAMALWKSPQTKALLNNSQQQAFLAHLALYMALRNHKD